MERRQKKPSLKRRLWKFKKNKIKFSRQFREVCFLENREDEEIQCGLPSTTGVDAETTAVDAVALLLRHKRGFTASGEEDHSGEPELPSSIAHEPQKKKRESLDPKN